MNKEIMKYLKNIGLVIIIGLSLNSCIDAGLEELPVFDEAEITAFNYEYRYIVKNESDIEHLAVMTMATEMTIDGTTVSNVVTVPPPLGSFTDEIRNQVSLQNLTGYASISTAAKIQPVEGAPRLGVPADYSSALKYKVIAADGTEKAWTVSTSLVK